MFRDYLGNSAALAATLERPEMNFRATQQRPVNRAGSVNESVSPIHGALLR
jgi:hypothetical protein